MERTPSDPLVDEIREIRRQISAEHGHDPARLVAYYMERQKEHQDRLLVDDQRERKDPSAA